MDIKTKSFEQALRTLRAVGAKYIVKDIDGKNHQHGDLKLAEPKDEPRKRAFPRGTYVKLVKSQGIENMCVGDVMTFDPEGKSVETTRCTVINYATEHWGQSSVTTSVNGGKIEALRIM